MCQLVYYKGKRIATIGALKMVLANLRKDKRVSDISSVDTDCLCSVDVPASAEASGMHTKTMMDGDYLLVEGPPPPDDFIVKVVAEKIEGTEHYRFFPMKMRRKRQ